MKIKCPHCDAENEITAAHIGKLIPCVSCKKEFECTNPNLAPCPDCFALISQRAEVCPKCGAPVTGDNTEEETIAVYHPATINFFWWILLGIVTIPFIAGIVLLIYLWIVIHFTKYELTTKRIIMKRGLISIRQDEIWIKDMRGVIYNQTFWQRIFHIGDIAIGTAASDVMEIYIMGIADPADIVKQINSLRKS